MDKSKNYVPPGMGRGRLVPGPAGGSQTRSGDEPSPPLLDLRSIPQERFGACSVIAVGRSVFSDIERRGSELLTLSNKIELTGGWAYA